MCSSRGLCRIRLDFGLLGELWTVCSSRLFCRMHPGYGLLGRLWTVCSSRVLWRIRLDFGLLEAGGRGLRTVCSSRVCGESIRSLGGWDDFEGLVGVGFASETCWSLGRWCCCENLVEEWFCWKSYWNLGWWIDGVGLANFAWCCEQGDVEVGICTLYDLPITTTVLVFLFRCFCQLFQVKNPRKNQWFLN